MTKTMRAIARLPRTLSAGLALAVAGGIVDVAYHVLADAPASAHGIVATTGHAITLAGMVVTMAGLLSTALRRRRVGGPARPKGEVR